MSTRRVRANPGDGVRLRQEILKAAGELLAETGTEEALTLRAVAGRTGVSTPSVYMHFANKEALIEAVCLSAWEELGRRMRESSEGIDDPFHALGRSGWAYARFALDHPTQYRVLMMRPSAAPGVPPAAEACFRYMVEGVTKCVMAGVLRGDPERLALGLWSAVHGCVSLLITQPSFPWPDDLHGLVHDTIMMAGLGTAIACRLPRRPTVPGDRLTEELDALAGRL